MFSLIVVFIILKLIKKVINKISSVFDDNYRSSYLKCGFVGRNYLSTELVNSQFEHWCKDFLQKLGYKNIICKSESVEGGINLISQDEYGLIYICTKLYKQKDSQSIEESSMDNYEEFSVSEAQKFIGAMVHDGVTRGILITTGDFQEETFKYIKNLPPIYNIKLIDGLALTKELRNIKRFELRKNNDNLTE